jgi:hypothetical protein
MQARRLAGWAPWIWVLATLAPLAPAGAQNLDAGKSAAQLFTEACSGCHRSPREVKGNSSASFLREHYTTGGEMAATMASYLAGFGGEPRGPGAAQPKQKSAPAAASRETPETARRPQQAEPKAEPKAASGAANREAAPATANRGRAGASEAKLPSPTPPAPTRPVLEDFEE